MEQHHEHETSTRQLETRVTRLEEGQTKLLSVTARIESMVENLAGGQKGVYDRINQPWQWGVVIAAFVALMTVSGVFATFMNMSVTPIKESLLHHEIQDQHFENRINDIETHTAVSQRDRYWLEKMSNRFTNQIDIIWEDIRLHHDQKFSETNHRHFDPSNANAEQGQTSSQ